MITSTNALEPANPMHPLTTERLKRQVPLLLVSELTPNMLGTSTPVTGKHHVLGCNKKGT